MGKNKRRHRNEDRLRKVEKLLKKLRKRRKYRSRSPSSTSTSTSEHDNQDLSSYIDTQATEYMLPAPIDLTIQPGPSVSVVPQDQPVTQMDQGDGTCESITLEHEFLNLLGEPAKEDSPIGPDIHVDIASRLQEIIMYGLKKEARDIITAEYPIPGNCQLFLAPSLNAEIKAAVTDTLNKKDSSLSARQGQIGIALTALVRAMDILIKEKEFKDQSGSLLRHISNASRILCDVHCIETKMRRNFLISTLNSKLKDTLKETKRDKTLFGEDLSEKLKTTKAITKTSQELKFPKQKVPTKNIASNNLNWKYPQPRPMQARNPKQNIPAYRTAGSRDAAPPRKHRGSTTRARTSAQYKHKKT